MIISDLWIIRIKRMNKIKITIVKNIQLTFSSITVEVNVNGLLDFLVVLLGERPYDSVVKGL